MKAVLLHFNERKFNEHLSTFEPALNALNLIYNGAFEVLHVTELSQKEFINLVNAPLETLFDILTQGKPVQIAGMELDKVKALELIKKPNGFDEFKSLIIDFRSTPHHAHVFNNIKIENSQVVLTDEFLKQEKRAFEIWASTDDSINAYKFASGIIELANNIFGEDKIDINRLVSNFIESKSYNPSFGTVNPTNAKIINRLNHNTISKYGQPGVLLSKAD